MAAAMFVALALEVLLGWPKWLTNPNRFEQEAGAGEGKSGHGEALALAVIVAACLLAVFLASVLPRGWPGILLTGLLAWPMVAFRAAHDQVSALARSLPAGDGSEAHEALERLADTSLHGLVAPLFWGALFGLPGVFVYCTIGDRGPISGRINWLANWLPSRLAGLLFALAAKARGTAFRSMRRDAGGRWSSGVGWPRAALAGALGVRLEARQDAADAERFLNPIGGKPRPEDVVLGLRLFRRAVLFAGAGLAIWAIVAL